MSGLEEIWEWVEREVELQDFATTQSEYSDIARMFAEDGRSPLDYILGDQKGEFLRRIEGEVGEKYYESSLEDKVIYGLRWLFEI
jgi:hypothetical protein